MKKTAAVKTTAAAIPANKAQRTPDSNAQSI
jgi:hypothetical protein